MAGGEEAALGEPPTGFGATLRLLRTRNFGIYFAGSLLSNCGTWFQNLAAAILVYRLTHSAFLLGVVSFAMFAAIVVLAPWTGSLADRFDRRKVMLAAQLGSFAVTGTLAALAWVGAASAAVVIGLSLLLGVGSAVGTPAMQALVPQLVEPHQLAGAIGLNSVTFNLGRAVGPALGALVIHDLGIPWAFALNAGSYVVFSLLLLTLRPRPQGPPPAQRPLLRESLAIVRGDRVLAGLLIATASISFSLDPVSTLGPAFATRVFHEADTWAGYLIGAFGAGAVTSVVVVTRRGRRTRRGIGTTLMLLAGGMLVFAVAPSLPVAFVALYVAGLGYLSSSTATTTRLLLEVDERQRGRIMALWSVAFLGMRPIAALIDGALASALGVRTAAFLMVLPTLLVALALLGRLPRRL